MVYKEKNKYLLARKQVLISITTTVLLDSGYFRKESSLNKNYIYRDKTCLVKKKAAHVIETYCRDSILRKDHFPCGKEGPVSAILEEKAEIYCIRKRTLSNGIEKGNLRKRQTSAASGNNTSGTYCGSGNSEIQNLHSPWTVGSKPSVFCSMSCE